MANEKFVVYPDTNLDVLKGVAQELDLSIPFNSDIDLAEELFNSGIRVSGTNNDKSPKEIYFVHQILEAVSEKGVLPSIFHVYLNDRGYMNIPETVPSMAIRKTAEVKNELTKCITEISAEIEKRKNNS